jgi:trans-aconitate methyltransferase
MTTGNRKQHWEGVYSAKQVHETSWHQDEPYLSLRMIENTKFDRSAAIIDVGGGASFLVDHLLDRSYKDLTVLDISAAALQQAQERLGEKAGRVEWVESDVTVYTPGRKFDLWHDRAAFHFLTSAEDRRRYLRVMREALKPEGQVIIASFAPDGPKKCSGLDIVQYDAQKMGEELGEDFVLQEQEWEKHQTPLGNEQQFGFYRFRRTA